MQFKLLILMTFSTFTFSNGSTETKHYQSFINMRNYFYPIDSLHNFSCPAPNLFIDQGTWFRFTLPDTNNQN